MLGPTKSYCDMIDTAMLKNEAERTTKYYPLRPSAAGYCSRRLAYDLMDYHGYATYEKEIKRADTLRLLNLGHSIEFSALRNMESLEGFDLRYKQQVLSMFRLDPTTPNEPGRLIEGSLDVVMWSEEHKGLLDVKSVGDRHSSAFSSKWDEMLDKYSNMKSLQVFGEPNEKGIYNAFYADDLDSFLTELNGDFLSDNLYQLNLYACAPFLVERGIDHAIVYRYCKNNSKHMEIRFRPSQGVFQRTFEKFNSINQAVHARTPEVVPKDSFLGSFRCAYCPFKSNCWGADADATKAWFATFPEKLWPIRLYELANPNAAQQLGSLFGTYLAAKEQGEKASQEEEKILAILTEEKITKIQLDNKQIYEVKFLKSPKPHFELRRGKL